MTPLSWPRGRTIARRRWSGWWRPKRAFDRATATAAKAFGETTAAKEQWQHLAQKQM